MKRLTLMIVLAAAACGDGSAPTAPEAPPATTVAPTPETDAAVTIVNFSFAPDALAVAVGTTVTWTNADSDIPHTTTSEGWNSGSLSEDETFSRTFTETGIFNYFCDIHPSMMGTITVTG